VKTKTKNGNFARKSKLPQSSSCEFFLSNKISEFSIRPTTDFVNSFGFRYLLKKKLFDLSGDSHDLTRNKFSQTLGNNEEIEAKGQRFASLEELPQCLSQITIHEELVAFIKELE